MTTNSPAPPNKRPFTRAQDALLRALYPHLPTARVAARLRRTVAQIYAAAAWRGLHKTAEYLASPAACRLRRGGNVGADFRYPKGHVPANKGLRRPGWHTGRMRETQFKKGQFPPNRDPDFYVIGALRVNTDGYIDMRVSFAPGAMGWRTLHRILWQDAHGPIPKDQALTFKDRDQLNVCLENLELISRADLMRRNSIHNLPEPLRKTIQVLGQLKRRINEKQDRRPA